MGKSKEEETEGGREGGRKGGREGGREEKQAWTQAQSTCSCKLIGDSNYYHIITLLTDH